MNVTPAVAERSASPLPAHARAELVDALARLLLADIDMYPLLSPATAHTPAHAADR